jgi:HEAT repeat protein
MAAFAKPVRWLGALTAGLTAAIVIARSSRSSPAEPEYEGQPLSYYLANLSYGDLRREREAVENIRMLGSNAVPHLIRILNQRESRLAGMRDWLRRQPWASWTGPYPLSLTTQQRHALMACQALGAVAAPAVPSFLRFTNDPELATHAVRALALTGPPAVPILTNLLQTGILDARVEAAGDLRYFGPRADITPGLLRALHDDPHPTVRARAADTLGVLRGQPATVVRALVESLHDPHPDVQRAAINSLGWFGLEAESAAPSLLRVSQQTTDTQTQQCLEQALGRLGWNPIPPPDDEATATR